MTVRDAEAVFSGWTHDPDVAKFMCWKMHQNVEDTRQWLITEEANLESDFVYHWGFVLKETGELIGSGGISFREDKGVYELAYNLMKKYWNHGLATEASQAIIDFGKTALHQTAFFGCHVKENPASGIVLTKVGFHYDHDGEYYCDNQERNLETMEYILTVEDEGQRPEDTGQDPSGTSNTRE